MSTLKASIYASISRRTLIKYGTLSSVTALVVMAVASFAQTTAEPPDHGAYYKAKDGWQKLEPLTATGNRVGAFSGFVVTYRGAEAPVQLTDRRPVFYIKTTPEKEQLMAIAARSTVIVLLNRKDDHRELQTVKSGLFGAKAGYDKSRLPEVTLHSINNLTLMVTPNQDLAPGEYLLTWSSMGSFGYDFGIK